MCFSIILSNNTCFYEFWTFSTFIIYIICHIYTKTIKILRNSISKSKKLIYIPYIWYLSCYYYIYIVYITSWDASNYQKHGYFIHSYVLFPIYIVETHKKHLYICNLSNSYVFLWCFYLFLLNSSVFSLFYQKYMKFAIFDVFSCIFAIYIFCL